MKKKVLLMTAVGLVLFGAVLGAALNAIFTVTDVVVSFAPVSQKGVEQSYALQEILDERFVGTSTTFLDLNEVKEVVAQYPAFELKEVKKDFPRTVVLEVAERREAMSFVRENGLFAVLDEEGFYLYDNEDNFNHRTGENILLKGFELTAAPGRVLPEGEYFGAAVTFVSVFLNNLEDARSNLVSIELMGAENEFAGSHFLRLQMREGVVIDVYNPDNLAKEKAESALEKYLSLTDAQRLYGFFDIFDFLGGGFTVSEHRAERPLG